MMIKLAWIAALAISIAPAVAQTAAPSSDGLAQKLAGAHFSTKSPTGLSDETWTNGVDGTAVVTRSGGLGMKAGASVHAEGRWSVNDAGQYCLHVEWDVRGGGPEDWCAAVAAGGDGAMTLTLEDGRKVVIDR